MLRSPIGSWFIAAGILLIPFSLAVGAESFPTRPIRLIVPFPPGSQPDTVARILVDQLSRDFGIVVVENRPGAGGTTGMKAAAAADPDGYTLVLGTTGSLTLGPAFFANAGYDPVRSFAPVAMIASAPFMLVVAPTLPVSTYAELVAYLKANPGKLSFGANTGSPPQFACDNFKRVTGTDMVHVVSRGPQAIADLLGGHVQVICEATTLLLPLVASRQAKPIIVMSAARLPELPDVPSTAEVSLPNSSITVCLLYTSDAADE